MVREVEREAMDANMELEMEEMSNSWLNNDYDIIIQYEQRKNWRRWWRS